MADWWVWAIAVATVLGAFVWSRRGAFLPTMLCDPCSVDADGGYQVCVRSCAACYEEKCVHLFDGDDVDCRTCMRKGFP